MSLDPLSQLYQTALGEPMTSVVFCGRDTQSFVDALSLLTAFAPNEYSLMLLPEGVAFQENSPGLRVLRDSSMDGAAFARSALRQDPDTLILDSRAVDCLSLLVQSKLTGHRVFFHHPKETQEAFEECRVESGRDGEFLAAAFLDRVLFVQLGEASVEQVWQVRQVENSELKLELLLERTEEGWNSVHDYQGCPAPASTVVAEEIFQIPDDWPQSGDAMLDELVTRLSPHRRTAWAPIMGSKGEAGTYGQFGGVPRLAPNEEWPCCRGCRSRMTLVLEVDLDKAPEPFQRKVGPEGIFQFFYCQNDHCSINSPWEPFHGNNLTRLLNGPNDRTAERSPSRYEAVAINGWIPLEEGPTWEERPCLDIDREFLQSDMFSVFSNMAGCSSLTEAQEGYYSRVYEYFQLTPERAQDLFRYVNTLSGDKLLGWPSWSQGVEYPDCPECGRQMEMLVQINNDGYLEAEPGSTSALGQLFAADGNGHIYHCPGHNRFTFGWACG